MTDINQGFATYNGDSQQPVYTIYSDAANTIPLNISAAAQITWRASRDPASAVVLTKTLTGSGIVFVTDGTDGKLYVNLVGANTSGLSGYYWISLTITDVSGNVKTVSVGRWQVAPTPAWTYSGDPSNSDRDAVRSWIGDTDPSSPLLMDSQIDFILTKFPNPMLAAANCCRSIGSTFSRKVSKRVGDLSINYSDMAKQFFTLAKELETQGNTFGLAPYSGGTSKSDMMTVDQNTDRVKPPFSLEQFDDRSSPFGSSGSGDQGGAT